MKPTVQYLQDKFLYYNNLCFKGELPSVAIKLSDAASFMGRMECKVKRSPYSLRPKREYLLKINARYDLTEEEIDDILLHEMIHYFIMVKRINDTSSHGKYFRFQMDRLNRDFGRHIKVSYKLSGEQKSVNTRREVQPELICVSRLKDGTVGITVPFPRSALIIKRAFDKSPSIESTSWYFCDDPIVNKYPRSRTPKIYRVDPVELDQALKGAISADDIVKPPI